MKIQVYKSTSNSPFGTATTLSLSKIQAEHFSKLMLGEAGFDIYQQGYVGDGEAVTPGKKIRAKDIAKKIAKTILGTIIKITRKGVIITKNAILTIVKFFTGVRSDKYPQVNQEIQATLDEASVMKVESSNIAELENNPMRVLKRKSDNQYCLLATDAQGTITYMDNQDSKDASNIRILLSVLFRLSVLFAVTVITTTVNILVDQLVKGAYVRSGRVLL